jgi:outer membrane protein W
MDRTSRALGVALCLAGGALSFSAYAQQAPSTDTLTLKPDFASAVNRMHFVRFGYTKVKATHRTSQAHDRTGPVVNYGDESTPGLQDTAAGRDAAGTLLYLSSNMRADHPNDYAQTGLGTPTGVSIRAGEGGNWTVALGTYLDDAKQWSVEAYVAGLPIEVPVYGAGRIGGSGADAVNLGQIMTTKQLGPIVIGKRVFGDKNDRFRPFVGLGGAYIVFLEAHATPAFEAYVGGPTRIKVKPAFGWGPFVGGELKLDERWSLNLTAGRLKLATKASATTTSNPDVLGRSPVTAQAGKDVGSNTLTAVQITNGTFTGGPAAINGPTNLLPGMLRELAKARTGDPENLGNSTRTVATKLDPWVVTLGVGYAF